MIIPMAKAVPTTAITVASRFWPNSRQACFMYNQKVFIPGLFKKKLLNLPPVEEVNDP